MNHGTYFERVKYRILLGCFALFLASGVASCDEIRYLASGKTAAAAITSANINRKYPDRLTVYYRFTDADGTAREEWGSTSADLKDTLTSGSTVQVQYLSGWKGDSRILGHNNAWLTIPFAACTIALVIFTIVIWRDYNEHERRKAARDAAY
jgi:hypothetical protein